MNKIITFILILTLVSCSEEKDQMGFQKEVMNEIFVALVDSLHQDFRIKLRPPAPWPSGVEMSDSIRKSRKEYWQRFKLEYKRKLDSVRKDSSKLFIVVDDTIFAFQDKYIDYKNELNEDIQFNWDSSSLATPYKIDLTSLNKNPLFRFLYGSDLPKGRELWRNENINGSVGFTRIVFDKTLKYGILGGGYSCGRLNGRWGWIFIKEENGKWVINRIEINEIS